MMTVLLQPKTVTMGMENKFFNISEDAGDVVGTTQKRAVCWWIISRNDVGRTKRGLNVTAF